MLAEEERRAAEEARLLAEARAREEAAARARAEAEARALAEIEMKKWEKRQIKLFGYVPSVSKPRGPAKAKAKAKAKEGAASKRRRRKRRDRGAEHTCHLKLRQVCLGIFGRVKWLQRPNLVGRCW